MSKRPVSRVPTACPGTGTRWGFDGEAIGCTGCGAPWSWIIGYRPLVDSPHHIVPAHTRIDPREARFA